MNYIDKNELHQLIDKCEEEAVLYEVKAMLTNKDEDWWDELTEFDKQRIIESEKQVKEGKFYTEEQMNERIDKWTSK